MKKIFPYLHFLLQTFRVCSAEVNVILSGWPWMELSNTVNSDICCFRVILSYPKLRFSQFWVLLFLNMYGIFLGYS
jgi:hypothetical protein